MKAARLTISTSRRRPEETPPPPDLYVEPAEDLLLLGEMMHDVTTIGELLRELPFSRLNYHGSLRVIRGAAVRLADRCARLLDEVETPKMPAHQEILRRAAEIAKASNKIDAAPGGLYPDTVIFDDPDAPHRDRPGVQPSPVSDPTRKSAGRRPKQVGKIKGREYSLAETFILSTLRDRGPMGTLHLLAETTEHGIGHKEAEEALASLRRDKKVISGPVGGAIENRLTS